VILSAVMMLKHLDEFEAAETIEHAVLTTLAEGGLTGDVVGYDVGLSTSAYTKLIIGNLGRQDHDGVVRSAKPLTVPVVDRQPTFRPATTKEIVGADVFLDANLLPAEIGPRLEAISEGTKLRLKMISNRGTKIYPDGNPDIDVVNHHRCRFVARDGVLTFRDVLDLVAAVDAAGLDVCHVERLLRIDGADGFTRAQGED